MSAPESTTEIPQRKEADESSAGSPRQAGKTATYMARIDLAKGPDHTIVTFRFSRAGFFSSAPACRQWEEENGRQLQAIHRYVDHVRDEVVMSYEVIR